MDFLKRASIFLWYKLLDLMYPKQCIKCGKVEGKLLCDDCYNKLFKNIIKKESKIEKYKNKYFDEHIYLFKYYGFIRCLILDYKFNDKAYLYEIFVNFIIKNEKICRKIKKYDIIIPVQIHKKRKRKRGYDQSVLIAKSLVKEFDKIQVCDDVLYKCKNTIQQSTLTREQRKQNVKEVYKIQNQEKIKGKRIILFDDIYTTGSTANECSRILKQNGAKEILVFTIAKD